MCLDCGGELADLIQDDHWERIYEQITRALLDGSASDIDADLHLKTAQALIDAVHEGMGGHAFDHGDDRADLVEALQRNLYHFSAAKSLVQMKLFRDLMTGADGKLRPYKSFLKEVANQGHVFNRVHLKAEHHLAQQSAIMADKWDRLTSEYLEYSTVGDDRVRPQHRLLDKFTAAKSDPVWDKIYPPKAYGCRCTVIPGKSQNAEKGMSSIEAAKMMKPLIRETIFDNHVGKSRVVFTDDHPVFIDAKGRAKNMNWKQYGLQSWEKISINPLDAFTPKSAAEYSQWWKDQAKASKDDIIVRDKTGTQILIPSGVGKKGKPNDYFKDHVISKPSEKRHEYAGESIRVLQHPDEVWQTDHGRSYIRYYDQGPIVVAVDTQRTAKTVYLLDKEGSFEKARTGILVYRK